MSANFMGTWWSEFKNFEGWDAAGFGAQTLDGYFNRMAMLEKKVAAGLVASADDLLGYIKGHRAWYQALAHANDLAAGNRPSKRRLVEYRIAPVQRAGAEGLAERS